MAAERRGVDFFSNDVEVDCHETPLKDVNAIGDHPRLQKLNLIGTALSDLSPPRGLKMLDTLQCGETKVHTVQALSTLRLLQFLQLNNTQVSDLTPLAQLPHLEQLYLMNTAVQDISPLANLQTL